MLEKKLAYLRLFDEYRNLLTERQRCVFELYYCEDLSLTEIAESLSVSKQAVSDMIRKSCFVLDDLESKLGLVEKNTARQAAIDSLLQMSIPEKIRCELEKISHL